MHLDLGLYKVNKVLVPKYIPSIMKKGDGGKGVLSDFLFTWIWDILTQVEQIIEINRLPKAKGWFRGLRASHPADHYSIKYMYKI